MCRIFTVFILEEDSFQDRDVTALLDLKTSDPPNQLLQFVRLLLVERKRSLIGLAVERIREDLPRFDSEV